MNSSILMTHELLEQRQIADEAEASIFDSKCIGGPFNIQSGVISSSQ
jgi:hypothetical protein